ncbi:MAG: ABC transporter ATP-binding protein, partial [Dehalococcoidia bacterium]
MLKVRSARKQYGKIRALDDASFELAAGRVLAVVGANGAGKSTLIKIVVGLMRFEGNVQVNGVDVRRDGRGARRHIGYLPQNPAFHHDMTVQETALFFARLRGAPAQEARAAVAAVGLEAHATKLVGALSGGMRQRLGLAVAQLGSPSLFVLDEPGTGLDVSARLELRDFIREQRAAGKSVLLSTHWLED